MKSRTKVFIVSIMVIYNLSLFIIVFANMLLGCAERESNEADNFNVVRQLTVINCIQGDILFQMTGKMSIKADTADNQLEVTVKDENGQYQKHFIGLSDNVTYVLEDIRTNSVDPYNYTLKYNPKMWLPIYIEKVN